MLGGGGAAISAQKVELILSGFLHLCTWLIMTTVLNDASHEIVSEFKNVSRDDSNRKQNFLTAKLPNRHQRLGPILDNTISINGVLLHDPLTSSVEHKTCLTSIPCSQPHWADFPHRVISPKNIEQWHRKKTRKCTETKRSRVQRGCVRLGKCAAVWQTGKMVKEWNLFTYFE